MLKYLRRLGWESTVICVQPESSWADRVAADSFCRVYEGQYQTVRVDIPAAGAGSLGMWGRFFKRGKLDYDDLWVESAVQAAKGLLAGNSFSAIVTFAQPWTDHLIGLRLGRSSRLPWIAHFSDPWVDSPYYESAPATTRNSCAKQEKAVVRNADAVVFITQETADLVMAKYPSEWQNKAYVVPHGFDDELLGNIPKSTTARKRLRLVYTGDFYGKRSPSGLFRALRLLNERRPLADSLEVAFIGFTPEEGIKEAADYGLSQIVHFHATVNPVKCLEMAWDSDVLLLIDMPGIDNVFLPSKLIDYLMLRKPILGLTPPKGASAVLLRRIDCPVVAPDDVEPIAAAIGTLLDRWATGSLGISTAFEQVAPYYHARSTASLMEAVLKEVVD
jgi:hypothetical protein